MNGAERLQTRNLAADAAAGSRDIRSASGGIGRVVAASFLGLAVSGLPIIIYTQSVFLRPMTQEFGWSRSIYFLPLSIGGVLGAFGTLLVGSFADRQGVRPWLLGGVVVFGLLNLMLAMTPGSYLFYAAVMVALILAASAQGPLLYTKAISEWATSRPGQALAIALTGTALGGMITPPLTVWLIEHHGWRVARAVLGGLVLLVALPAVWAVIRPPPPEKRSHVVDLETNQADNSLTLSQAFRTRHFLQILTGVFAAAVALNGLLANMAPLVTDRGLTPRVAAFALSGFALAQVLGRLLSGVVLDRIPSSKSGAVGFALAIPGILLLGWASTPASAVAGAMLLGLALGSELQLGAYFTLRFFGLQHYGSIYGMLMAVFTVGSTGGPLMMGVAFDRTGGNAVGLILCIVALAYSVAAFLTLGKYRFAAPGAVHPPLRT